MECMVTRKIKELKSWSQVCIYWSLQFDLYPLSQRLVALTNAKDRLACIQFIVRLYCRSDLIASLSVSQLGKCFISLPARPCINSNANLACLSSQASLYFNFLSLSGESVRMIVCAWVQITKYLAMCDNTKYICTSFWDTFTLLLCLDAHVLKAYSSQCVCICVCVSVCLSVCA